MSSLPPPLVWHVICLLDIHGVRGACETTIEFPLTTEPAIVLAINNSLNQTLVDSQHRSVPPHRVLFYEHGELLASVDVRASATATCNRAWAHTFERLIRILDQESIYWNAQKTKTKKGPPLPNSATPTK